MTHEIRRTQPHEYRQAQASMAVPLLAAPLSDDDWERSKPSWDEMISFSAWDGDECLGHAGQFPVETLVPGGALVPTGAVSRVGVMPTARRRGIGRELMERVIVDGAERGQVLQSLRASEATIYGRFGFAVAGDYGQAVVRPATALPVRGAAPGGSIRILQPDEIVDALGPLYERIALRRPGALTRPASWTRRYVRTAVERSAASFVAVHTDADGVDDGFVHYQVQWDGTAGNESSDSSTGIVGDLFGADDRVELALWSYVLQLDLVTRWTLRARPTDEILQTAITDRRSFQWDWLEDEQWLRIIDVDAALGARAYRPATGAVTVAVTDPLIDANTGTWQISADGAERTSEAADDAAELVTDINGLSATYLGGVSWGHLVASGTARAAVTEAIEIADVLMGSSRRPFCGSFF